MKRTDNAIGNGCWAIGYRPWQKPIRNISNALKTLRLMRSSIRAIWMNARA